MKKTFTKLLMLLGVFLFLGAGTAHADYKDVYIRGNMFDNGWNLQGDNNKFWHEDGNQNNFAFSVTLNPGTYEFKIWCKKTNNTFNWFSTTNETTVSSNDGKYYLAEENNGNTKNMKLVVNGTTPKTYLFNFNANSNNELIVNELKDVYLRYYDGSGDIKFTRLSSGIYTLVTKAQSDKFKIATLDYSLSNYGNGNENIGSSADLYKLKWAGDNMKFSSDLVGKDILILFDRETEQMRVETIPETMHLVGEFTYNGVSSNWDLRKMANMTQESPGIFTIKNVKIDNSGSGFGYFSFCERTSTGTGLESDDDQRAAAYKQILPRFGALYDGFELTTSPGHITQEDLYAISNQRSDAYKVKAGNYDITVDLNQLIIKISESKVPVTFSWSSESAGEVIPAGNTHKDHIKNTNTYTLGVGDNTTWNNVQNYVSINVAKKSTSNVAAHAEDYTVSGNSVTFNQPGVYTLTASLRDGTNIHNYVTDNNNHAITVELTTVDLNLTLSEEEASQKWEKGDVSVEFSLTTSISGTLPIEGKDLKVNVTPQNTVDTDEMPSNMPNNFIPWAWDQMTGIIASGTSTDYNVDGYYNELGDFSASFNGNSGLIVSGHFPVSGTYEITISSDDSEVVINGGTATVSIYPNTGLLYSDYKVTYKDEKGNSVTSEIAGPDGININGMQIKDNTIEYPYDENSGLWGDYKNARLYTPGNYMDNITYVLSDESLGSESEIDTSSWAPLTGQTLDLSQLANTTPMYLGLLFTKNGVSAPVKVITLTRSSTETTGIEVIETEVAEEGEAVYYNLQGVRVENPQHGIYVKVVNGQASKVVL